jgi:chromosome segregation ATPase
MVEGTAYEDYVARMEDINDYVRTSQAKLRELEESLRKSNSTSSAYASTIRKLKRDLEKTSRELVEMQALVDKYKNENDNLVHTVSLQDSSLVEKEKKIKVHLQELADLETKVDNMMVQATEEEADAYYSKAQVVEELARRTRFAPRKKKETRKEALELYRMAFTLGKTEAADKISELESKI